MRLKRALLLLLLVTAARPASAKILVPMDDKQTDHLKAYGLAYWSLAHGGKAEESEAGWGIDGKGRYPAAEDLVLSPES